MRSISSVKHNSILRMKNKQSLEFFTWDRVWSEICDQCPILSMLLKKCLPIARNESFIPPVTLCCSILLKLQNPHINLVQGLLSIILKSGHASKQVCYYKFLILYNYTSTM